MSTTPNVNELFLASVLEQREQLESSRFLLEPPERHLSALVMGLALALTLFLVFGQFGEHHKVSGELVARHTAVRAPFSGTVSGVFVREGDRVASGQPLLGLDRHIGSADPQEAAAAELIMDTQMTAIEHQREAAVAQFGQRERALSGHESTVVDQLYRLHRRLTLLEVAYQSAASARRRDTSLVSRGLHGRSILSVSDARLIEVAGELYDVSDRIADAREELKRFEQRRASDALAARRELSGIDERRAALQVARQQYRDSRHRLVRAPVASRITLMDVYEGKSFQAGEALMALTHGGQAIAGRMLVGDRAYLRLRQGSVLNLRFDAFGPHDSRIVRGRVVRMSAAPWLQLAANVPGSRYLVELELVVPKDVELRQGMQFTARVRGPSRPLLDWLFVPAGQHLSRLRDG